MEPWDGVAKWRKEDSVDPAATVGYQGTSIIYVLEAAKEKLIWVVSRQEENSQIATIQCVSANCVQCTFCDLFDCGGSFRCDY